MYCRIKDVKETLMSVECRRVLDFIARCPSNKYIISMLSLITKSPSSAILADWLES